MNAILNFFLDLLGEPRIGERRPVMYFTSGSTNPLKLSEQDRRYQVVEDNRYDPSTRSYTLAEALPAEQKRVREVREAYCEIGPAGYLGTVIIDQALARAEQAAASGDVIAMLRSYEELRGITG